MTADGFGEPLNSPRLPNPIRLASHGFPEGYAANGVFRGSRHSFPGRRASETLRVLRGSYNNPLL
jgi:hypothetical protein